MDEFRQTCEEVIHGPEATAIPCSWARRTATLPCANTCLEARALGDAGAKDDVLITSGCQQAMDLVSRVLAGAGEPVAVEDPVYPGLRSAFHQHSRLIGLPVDTTGLDVDAAEQQDHPVPTPPPT